MKYESIFFIIFLLTSCTNYNFEGQVFDYDTDKPISKVLVSSNNVKTETDSSGSFSIKIKANSNFVISFKKEGYASKEIYRNINVTDKNSLDKLRKNKIYLYNVESDFYNKKK